MVQRPIRLVAGLGNPGPQYEDTRHNAGAWLLTELARHLNCPLQFEKHFSGRFAKVKKNGHDVFLLIPDTYMNLSGQAVGAVARFFKLQADEILIAHDELDLLPGQLKIKQGGGHAGHNGLKDIHAHLGSAEFWRARLGIGHPRSLNLTQGVADFVLHRPNPDHKLAIDHCIHNLIKHLDCFLAGNFNQAIARLHTDPNKII